MSDWKIKLLHDGRCPLCRREVAMMQRLNRDGAVAFEDITAPDFDPRRYGIEPGREHAEIHAVLPDGSVVRGVEVFRRVYRELGRGWLVAWTAWPIIRPIADAVYRLFAKLRPYLQPRRQRCRQGACDLPTDPSVDRS
jgi:predicted DCC family thiol-disulfide oxidoreductase YuxK